MDTNIYTFNGTEVSVTGDATSWFRTEDGFRLVRGDSDGVTAWSNNAEDLVFCDYNGLPMHDHGEPIDGDFFTDATFVTITGSVRTL